MGKIKAKNCISGTHGYLWWDGELIAEITSFEATLKPDTEKVTFAGDMWEDRKLMGLSGEYKIKIKKVYSRAAKIAEAFKKGEDPRAEFTSKLDDPDALGHERISLHNCWFDDLTLQTFESKKITEEEYSGGFTGFDYLDKISA